MNLAGSFVRPADQGDALPRTSLVGAFSGELIVRQAARRGGIRALSTLSVAKKYGLNIGDDAVTFGNTPIEADIERSLNQRLAVSGAATDMIFGIGLKLPPGVFRNCDGEWCTHLGMVKYRLAVDDAICRSSGDVAECEFSIRFVAHSLVGDRGAAGVSAGRDPLASLVQGALSQTSQSVKGRMIKNSKGWELVENLEKR